MQIGVQPDLQSSLLKKVARSHECLARKLGEMGEIGISRLRMGRTVLQGLVFYKSSFPLIQVPSRKSPSAIFRSNRVKYDYGPRSDRFCFLFRSDPLYRNRF